MQLWRNEWDLAKVGESLQRVVGDVQPPQACWGCASVVCPEETWLAMPWSFQKGFCWAALVLWRRRPGDGCILLPRLSWDGELMNPSVPWLGQLSTWDQRKCLSRCFVLSSACFPPLLWSALLDKTGLNIAHIWGQKHASGAKPGSGSVMPWSPHLLWLRVLIKGLVALKLTSYPFSQSLGAIWVALTGSNCD